MSIAVRKDIFPFGTHFYRNPGPPVSELKRDMRTMKKLGFNMLKIQESWCIDNPREDEINFSTIEELLTEANQLNLYVYLGITMEQVPAWVWKKYPDCRLVNAVGESYNDPTQYLLPSDGKPGPCWDHPGVRKEAEGFMVKLAQQLGRFDNIIVWNSWQEVCFYSEKPGSPGGVWPGEPEHMFCYCRYTLNRFRCWLRKKYGNLQTLNKAWHTGFGEWDEVEPPRHYLAVPSFIDWRAFMKKVYLVGVTRWKSRILRENDPQGRPVMCHMSNPGGVAVGSGISWYLAQTVDLLGVSFYPAWTSFSKWDAEKPSPGQSPSEDKRLNWEMWTSSLYFDYIRSAAGRDKGFWVAEFQGGPATIDCLWKGAAPSPSDIRLWLMLALSTGATGINFWNHKPDIFWWEGHSFGLCDGKGEATDRATEAGKIGEALQAYPHLFAEGKMPSSQVAIIINEDLYSFTQASQAREHLSNAIRGIYKSLWQKGIWADFVESDEVCQGALSDYRAVILPFPVAISDPLVKALSDYVEKGGTLISEACPGRYGKYGFANPSGLNSLMEELVGASEKDVFVCKEWGEESHWTPLEGRKGDLIGPLVLDGTGSMKGSAVQANVCVETFTPSQGKPILFWENEVVGVVNSWGKGEAYLIGTILGHAVATYEDADTAGFLLEVLRKAGVTPERCGKLLRRRRLAKDDEAWFFFNLTGEALTESCDFSGFLGAKDLLGEEIRTKNNKLEVSVAPLSVRCIVVSKPRR